MAILVHRIGVVLDGFFSFAKLHVDLNMRLLWEDTVDLLIWCSELLAWD